MPPVQKTNRNVVEQEKPVHDPAAERLVLSGLLKYGEEYYFQVDSFLKESDFYLTINQIIYHHAVSLLKENPNNPPSSAAVLAKIDHKTIAQYELHEYLESLASENIQLTEAQSFAKRVAKNSLIRNLQSTLHSTIKSLGQVKEDESLRDILIKVEQPLAEFTTDIVSPARTINLVDSLDAFIDKIPENKTVSRGIPSGMPRWDKTIGGGLRKPGVHIIGARPGQGKSFLAVNCAYHCMTNSIPVLYLDTELSEEITLTRFASRFSGVKIDDIESGQANIIQLKEFSKKLKDKKFHYHNISGTPHTHWISEMRKWIIKQVGFNPDGSAKDCLLILDYIKIMDLSVMAQFKEYQYLGQIITDLHNFCIQYNVAMLCLAQINRDGIDSDSESVLADSDRLNRLCSSFTIFRKKTEEDFAGDPSTNGNRKLITKKARFGAGMDDGEYINLKCDFSVAKIEEGNSNINNRIQGNKRPAQTNFPKNTQQTAGNNTPNDDDDTIPL